MTAISALGFFAGALTTLSNLPQVIKIYKLKETRDLSLVTYIMVNVGIILWLIYGIILNDPPIWAANLVALFLTAPILYFKIQYK